MPCHRPHKTSLLRGLNVQVQEEDYLGGGQTLASGFRVSIQVNIKSYMGQILQDVVRKQRLPGLSVAGRRATIQNGKRQIISDQGAATF